MAIDFTRPKTNTRAKNINQLANAIKASPHTIRSLHKRGKLPYQADDDYWDVFKVCDYLEERNKSKSPATRRRAKYHDELQRKNFHQANINALEEQKMRGNLFEREHINENLREISNIISSRLNTLAVNLAPELEGLKARDIEKMLANWAEETETRINNEVEKGIKWRDQKGVKLGPGNN